MAIERVWCPITAGAEGLRGPLVRYGFLVRLRQVTQRREVELLGFGLGEGEVRLILEGRARDVSNALRGLKVGTTRRAKGFGVRMQWGPSERDPVEDELLTEALAWAHRAPVDSGASGPLASPWSSHRDLLLFRKASFFGVDVVFSRVEPRRVHALCGGKPLPDGWPPPHLHRESLNVLLRVAAAVIGVLPADRRCFRLFVHLARHRGWATRDLAGALRLSARRIRQLFGAKEPFLGLALTTLADPRLSRVP